MTRVSIVITCYNLGLYLEEALASALAQNYEDFEILLIDDGSTDPITHGVLNRLPAHPRLQILRTSNQGVSRARNYAISVASGAYILPLDADDRILPDYLASATAVLDQRPEVGFVGCHYRTFGEHTLEYQPGSYSLPELLVENVVPIASVFRRTCWEQVGGYCADMNGMEDWDLWLGILGQGYVGAVLPNMLFEYRMRANSNISQVREPEVYQRRLQLLYERHRRLYDAHVYGVLSCKDLLMGKQIAHNAWLEQRCRMWEDIAQQRLTTIDALSMRNGNAERMHTWWRRQSARWQRILNENQSTAGRAIALASGGRRVLRRKLLSYLQKRRQFSRQHGMRTATALPQPAQSLSIARPEEQITAQWHSAPQQEQLPVLQENDTVGEIVNLPGETPVIQENDTAGGTVNSAPQLPENAIVLDDFYPINPIPRYGYGRPFPPKILEVLEQGLSEYQQTLESFQPFTHQLLQINRDPNPDQPTEPAWINGFLPGLDSLTLFGLISALHPRIFLEIGSGNSTRFAAKAKILNSPQTKIISIDPYPRVEIDRLCDENVREPLEAVDLHVFDQLSAGDVLFFDGSHRVFQNSDVTAFFIDILPYLKSGVYIHIHDIVWPLDYPPGWEHRYYSEQYMLAMILLFGLEHFQIVLPNSYIARCTDLTHLFDDIWKASSLTGIERHGGSFWLRKI
jgi:glycosyltransferase involved in cell wall biosynthesis